MLFDLADREATLFSAQQALLTEGRARNAAEESYQHLTAALAHTIKERDAIAAKLAECRNALGRCIRDSTEPDKVYIHASKALSGIEARRAKEARDDREGTA